MLRLAGLAFVLASVPAAGSAAAAPNGRVVRVVRAGDSRSTAPRLCDIRGDSGTCIGEQPRSGQHVMVLDEHRVVAEVQIVEASTMIASCQSVWTVKTRPIHGVATDSDGIGVIDLRLDPSRARVLEKARNPASPSGHPGDEVLRAVDRDGDGIADILITRYSCDVSGKPSAAPSPSCIDIWARTGAQSGGKLVRASQLNFAPCNL